MGHQIILQPGCDPAADDALFSVFSSVVDGFVLVDATAEQVAAYEADIAAEAAREATMRMLERVRTYAADDKESPGAGLRRPYHQFTMTYAEAAETHLMHGHDVAALRGTVESVGALTASVDYQQGRALNADGRCVNCNPDDEDPRAWCDCRDEDYPPAVAVRGCTGSYVGGACRLLAHAPANCPLRAEAAS